MRGARGAGARSAGVGGKDALRSRRFGLPRLAAPGVAVLAGWRRTLRADVVAGAAVSAYLVPQCMAYARLAELQPVSGLWAVFPALLAYALLGTSSRLSVGPESASALLVGVSVVSLAPEPAARPAVAAALAISVAVIALASWAVRLGFLADLLSKPVMVGYMAGVGVTMAVSQLPALTGVDSTHRETMARLFDFAGNLGDLRFPPLLVGASIVAFLVVSSRFPKIPGPLVAVLAATAATVVLGLEDHGLATVGEVPRGLPSPALPGIPVSLWPGVLGAALGISVVAYSDNVLTARAFAVRAGDRIDANQEFLALAAANAAAGIAGGFPVSSSGSRTALGDSAGARSQLASVVAAIAVLAVLLVAGPLLESFPLAALGGLVVYAAVRLIDFGELRRLGAFRRNELALAIAAFAGVVAFNLLVGIGLAIALSVLELFARIARAHDAVQGKVPGLAGFHDIDDYPEAETAPGLVVYRYDAPLCFANAENFRARVMAAVEAEVEPVEWVLLNMEANVEVDLTAIDMLEELRSELERRGVTLAMARVKQDLLVFLRRGGLADRIGSDHLFPTLPTAVEAFERRPRR